MKLLDKIFHFHGGIHTEGHKELAAGRPLEEIPRPKILTISMSQHLGAPATPCVKPGDHVVKYQKIADASGFISSPVHTPHAGVVKSIISSATASTRVAPAVVIELDNDDGAEDAAMTPIPDWKNAPIPELLNRIREAGVVGAGGAGFPTCVKLSPPKDKVIDTVIVNGAECEPYLNGDNRLMIQMAKELWEGISIVRHILGAKRVIFAVEDNKPVAIESLRKALADTDAELAILPHSYPQGSEKHIIYSTTGRVVQMGKLPADVGCVVENVWTILTIWSSIVKGIPVVIRTVTVTGDVVAKPSNFAVPIGATVAELVAAAGGFTRPPVKAICGGPMMGFAMPSLDVPITKTCSGLVFLSEDEVCEFESNACINCGRCIEACPMGLMPREISLAVEADDIAEAEVCHVMNCFECGSCAFVCPAHRPLVQHNRRAKAIIVARQKAAQAAAEAERAKAESKEASSK